MEARDTLRNVDLRPGRPSHASAKAYMQDGFNAATGRVEVPMKP